MTTPETNREVMDHCGKVSIDEMVTRIRHLEKRFRDLLIELDDHKRSTRSKFLDHEARLLRLDRYVANTSGTVVETAQQDPGSLVSTYRKMMGQLRLELATLRAQITEKNSEITRLRRVRDEQAEVFRALEDYDQADNSTKSPRLSLLIAQIRIFRELVLGEI